MLPPTVLRTVPVTGIKLKAGSRILAVVAKRQTEEDRSLAGQSRVLRTEEFGQLRKDQVTVLTGTLSGKLLGDVLMGDLMENSSVMNGCRWRIFWHRFQREKGTPCGAPFLFASISGNYGHSAGKQYTAPETDPRQMYH